MDFETEKEGQMEGCGRVVLEGKFYGGFRPGFKLDSNGIKGSTVRLRE